MKQSCVKEHEGQKETKPPIGGNVVSLSDGTDTEAVNTVDLLRSCQATYVACHDALERSLRIQVYLLVRQDPWVRT